MDVIIRGEAIIAREGSWLTPQSPRTTATGSMEYLAMKHLAQDTGPVGMAQQRSSSALVDCSIMRIPMRVTGPSQYLDVRSIPSAKTTQMETWPLGSPATVTGNVRVGIQGYRGVLLCWFLIKRV